MSAAVAKRIDVQDPIVAKKRTRVLGLFTAVFGVLATLMLLFLPFVARQDMLLQKPVDLSGTLLFSSMTNGNSLTVMSFGNAYTLEIPPFILISFIAFVVLSVVSALIAIVWPKHKRVAGVVSGITAVLMIVYFAVLILSESLHTVNFAHDTVTLYKVFSPGLGYLLALLMHVFAFACGFFVREETLPKIRKFWFLYLLLIIPFILIAALSYYPIFLQVILAFKDYKSAYGIYGSDWVGLQHFYKIFTDPEMLKVIWNTVYISLIRLVSNLFPPIVMAIVINEITHKFFKKSVQNITYIPHFFSWVILYGIVYAFLSPSGIANSLLNAFGKSSVDFLTSEEYFIPILVISAIWKDLGWNTIIYLAALTSVDTQLYDAAAVDGIGPFQKLRYITLPQLSSVFMFQLILAIGNILRGAGGDQILLFANSGVMDKANVIDTWVYWQGLGNMQYGLGAAVSFVQSFIGMIMVLAANKVSSKVAGRSLW